MTIGVIFKIAAVYFEPGIKTQWERGTGVFDQFCGSDPGVVLGASLHL